MYQRDFHRNPPQNKQVLDRMQLRVKIMENATSSENNGRVLCQKRFIQLFRWLCVRFAPLLSLFDLHSSLKPWMLGSDRKPSEISYFRKYQVAPCHFQPELIYSQRIWTSTEGILAVRPTLIQEKWSISDNRPFSFNHSFTHTLSVPCSVSNLSERDECTHLTQMINLLFQKFFILFALFPKGKSLLEREIPKFFACGDLYDIHIIVHSRMKSAFFKTCNGSSWFRDEQNLGSISLQRRKNEHQTLIHHERPTFERAMKNHWFFMTRTVNIIPVPIDQCHAAFLPHSVSSSDTSPQLSRRGGGSTPSPPPNSNLSNKLIVEFWYLYGGTTFRNLSPATNHICCQPE